MGKNFNFSFCIITLLFLLQSCDPDPVTEQITLPTMNFAFSLNKQDSYLKVGDTLRIRAAISNNINNIKLLNGEGEIFASISRGDSIPQRDFYGNYSAIEGTDILTIINNGSLKYTNSEPKYIIRFTSSPQGDSIIMDYSFVLLKPGLYCFGSFQPSFYEGSNGKGRWDAFFNVENPNWDKFWKVDGYPALNINDNGYKKSYWVAVTN